MNPPPHRTASCTNFFRIKKWVTLFLISCFCGSLQAQTWHNVDQYITNPTAPRVAGVLANGIDSDMSTAVVFQNGQYPANFVISVGWTGGLAVNGGGGVIEVYLGEADTPYDPIGFNARLLLSDGSYTSKRIYTGQGSVQVVPEGYSPPLEVFDPWRMTLNVDDFYQGPLKVMGIELSDMYANGVAHDGGRPRRAYGLALFMVRGTEGILVPEPSALLMALGGVPVLFRRKRRAAPACEVGR